MLKRHAEKHGSYSQLACVELLKGIHLVTSTSPAQVNFRMFPSSTQPLHAPLTSSSSTANRTSQMRPFPPKLGSKILHAYMGTGMLQELPCPNDRPGSCMQGRGPKTHAFTHALDTEHHMYMKLDNGKVTSFCHWGLMCMPLMAFICL